MPDLGGGGAERVFVNIANGFLLNGIEVEMLLGVKRGVYFNLLSPAIPVHELGTSSFTGYLKKLPPFLKKNSYSHIFTTSDYLNISLILVKRIYKFSYLVILNQQYSCPSFKSVKGLKEDIILTLIHKFFTHRADKIITASNEGLKWLRKKTDKKLSHAVVIYNPVYDDGIFTKAKQELKLPMDTRGKKILLNIGRLVRQKDQTTLIKAFKALPNHDNFILIILGVGAGEPSLKMLVAKLGLTNSVFFAGFDDNPYRWISRCDLFVLSSINEGFGNVIVEAMALGKTVVTTDCPTGPREITKGGQYGYLCKVKDELGMARTIVTAINSPINPEILMNESRQYKNENIIRHFINILE